MDKSKKLTIISISAEIAPFSKAGGLGDVARSLPKALKRKGHKVICISPLHGVIDPKEHGLKKIGNDIPIEMDETKTLAFDYWQGYLMEGLPVYFIDRHDYFSKFKTIYGTEIANERFFFFNMAALKLVEILGIKPDIIQCHDWHSGLIPYFAKKRFKESEQIKKSAIVYTIHNLAFQSGHKGTKKDDGISAIPKFNDIEAIKSLNFAKRAIINSDIINTVSEQYAKEIMTPIFGEDLHRILKNRSDRVLGIVNGIDYNDFNPKKDPSVHENYDHRTLDKKISNKIFLQKIFNLPQNKDIPILGMVTRISEQKGFDLLMEISDSLLEQEIQIVIAGSGEKRYEDFFKKIQKQYPNKVSAHLIFDTTKASQIYAGSDIFLMPSRFEPCGLGQLISLRYGSVPVVHSVGGLVDTVTDYNPKTKKGNGFVFKKYDPHEFLIATIRAIETYKHSDSWRKLVKLGMMQSNSWEIPAKKYIILFKKAIKIKNSNK